MSAIKVMNRLSLAGRQIGQYLCWLLDLNPTKLVMRAEFAADKTVLILTAHFWLTEVKLAGNKTQSIDIDSASSDGAYSQTFQQMPSTNFNWNSLLNPTLFYSFQHPIDSFVSFETSVVQAQSNQ